MNLNATILAQILIFGLVIWVTMKFLWPEITGTIQERARKIAEGLAAAERGQKDLQAAEARVEELVKAARERALAMEHQAQARANQIVEAAKQSAQSEAARLLEAAQAQVALETQKARDELRRQVAVLAVSGAEKIIGREIDARTHAQLLDQLAAGI
ncbi:MAG: F0F1 ATP synthase subunit B [Gammaproteobacteria bacterium]|nr:F0F1 ATP synthase subunit B [Gammaproteobacteria bacterium]MDE2251188.1 F0F1 ATP synthase subunit B [Gammaproteobacteria bacterium]